MRETILSHHSSCKKPVHLGKLQTSLAPLPAELATGTAMPSSDSIGRALWRSEGAPPRGYPWSAGPQSPLPRATGTTLAMPCASIGPFVITVINGRVGSFTDLDQIRFTVTEGRRVLNRLERYGILSRVGSPQKA